MHTLRLITLLPLAMVASPALAQSIPAAGDDPVDGKDLVLADPASPTEAITVTADKTPRSTDEVGQSVTVIARDQIERRQSVAVQDLLRTVPGVTVARNGGLGGTGSTFIRGAGSDQTLMLIDGIKLSDPSSTGTGYFGTLLTSDIEKIEVVRGAQSVIWGSQAIGGVINLITRTPTYRLSIDANAEGGSVGHALLSARVADTLGPVAFSLNGGWITDDGVSAFDTQLGGRERDGFRQLLTGGKARVTLSDAVSVDLIGRYSASHAGIDGYPPPTYSFGDTAEYAENNELLGYAGLNVALLDGRFKNRIGAAYTRIDRDFFDPASAPFDHYSDSTGINRRFDYQGTLDLDAVSAVFGFEHELSSFRSVSYGAVTPRQRASLDGLYGELTLRPIAGLILTGGARHDWHSDFGEVTTLSASGSYSPNGGDTRLRMSYGEGFKAPSLYQLFGDYGNTMLNPERSTGWDIGLTQKLLYGRIVADVTYFHRLTRDQVDFISCFGDTRPICTGRPWGTYDNIGRAKAEGVEATLTLIPTDGLSVSGQYSFIAARDRDTGLELARRPRQTVSALIDYRWPFGLSTGATIAHVGDSYDNAANTVRLDGYVLVDLRAALPLTDRIELYGRIENLFDARYETVFGYGTPRRAVSAGVRLRL